MKERAGWRRRGGEDGGPLEALSVIQHSWDGGGRGASIPNDSHLSKVGTVRPQSSPSQNPPEGGGRGRGGEGRGGEGGASPDM